MSERGVSVILPYNLPKWTFPVAVGAVGLLLMKILMKPKATWSGPPEAYAPLESEEGCDLSEKPGVSAFRQYVLTNYGGYDAGILRDCAQGGASGHKLGKSWDWGIDRSGADVDGLLAYLFANDNEVIRRAGITYFIYNQHIWNTRAQAWQNYTGADPHTSHIHFSFGTPGALGQTSGYQGGGGSFGGGGASYSY